MRREKLENKVGKSSLTKDNKSEKRNEKPEDIFFYDLPPMKACSAYCTGEIEFPEDLLKECNDLSSE